MGTLINGDMSVDQLLSQDHTSALQRQTAEMEAAKKAWLETPRWRHPLLRRRRGKEFGRILVRWCSTC